uniref:Amino acid transporter transmembrane domain-containing protein n=1 Tax=Physcomitrium patens TaxID=3218 RepID=A0A2K1K6P8_PHYPA|nr:hypothetical protein PHYPA_011350 [Physcomitrium patens]
MHTSVGRTKILCDVLSRFMIPWWGLGFSYQMVAIAGVLGFEWNFSIMVSIFLLYILHQTSCRILTSSGMTTFSQSLGFRLHGQTHNEA